MKPLNRARNALIAITVATGALPFSTAKAQTPDPIVEKLDSTVTQIPAEVETTGDKILDELGMTRQDTDSAEFARMPWIKQLYKSRFDINAPGINYPKFPRFIVKVYNWADWFFNGFEPEYVTGTGKNFKAFLKSYNWFQNYRLFHDEDNYVRIRSNIYSDLGPNISYKAVTVGYMADLTNLKRGAKIDRRNFVLDFTSGLFSASLNIHETKGATKITHIGEETIRGGFDFNGVNEKSTEFTAYYFFNHRRYSQGAAYSMSRFQQRSAGSWIAGINMSHRSIALDFSSLPDALFDRMPGLQREYSFRYNSYNIVVGYGYNWAIRPRTWLVNVTAMPVIGYLHSFEGTTEGRINMLSTNLRLMGSLVYNHRQMFATAQIFFQGSLQRNKGYTFLDTMTSLAILVGVRF